MFSIIHIIHKICLFLITVHVQVGQKAMFGKVLDMETRGDPSLSHFNMETYSAIAKYKNTYHSFKLPSSLALYMVSNLLLKPIF